MRKKVGIGFVFAVLLIALCCNRYSPIDLKTLAEQTYKVTVYDVNMFDLKHNYTNDLSHSFFATFNTAIFRESLPAARFVKQDMDGSLHWKGGSLVVVTLQNGTTEQLVFSCYGNFFVVVGKKGYYSFGEHAGREWAKEYYRIMVDDFIPKRYKRNAEQNRKTP